MELIKFKFKGKEYSVTHTVNGVGILLSSPTSHKGFPNGIDQAIECHTNPEFKKKLIKVKESLTK